MYGISADVCRMRSCHRLALLLYALSTMPQQSTSLYVQYCPSASAKSVCASPTPSSSSELSRAVCKGDAVRVTSYVLFLVNKAKMIKA